MEIVFRDVHLSFQEYASVNLKYAWRRQKFGLFRIVLVVVAIAGFQVYRVYSDNLRNPDNAVSTWWFVLFVLLVLALLLYASWRGLRRRYANTQFLQKPATYTFADAGVTIFSPTTQGFNSWETIKSLLLMQEFALVTTQNFTVYFLDFRCLAAPATKADFLALMQRHNIPVE